MRVPLLLALLLASPAAAQAPNTSNPSSTVKLVFVHHSTGENWLRDDDGGLGIALRDANYFVSDTNYGWGPEDADAGYETIGDHTDIGHWYTWFSGAHRDTYLAALYAESEQHAEYARRATDPGGANRVVMIKSCFPNARLTGPASPIPPIEGNPLRGESASSDAMTVANAKGIYVEILKYFATRPDVLFVVVVNPPLGSFETDVETAANARLLAAWLVNDWLNGYAGRNVFVFDFFNVLTSNGGSSRTNAPEVNDAGWSDGNHHRVRNAAYEHLHTVSYDMSAYATGGDSHPTTAGNEKATAEFVPLLNAALHCWQGDGACASSSTETCTVSSCGASAPTAGTAGAALAFTASIQSTGCTGSESYDWDFGDGSPHATAAAATHAYASAGTYGWSVAMALEGHTCTRSGSVTITGGGGGQGYTYVVPAVAHSSGAMGTLWRSDVAAVNRASSSASVTLTFLSTGGERTSRGSSVSASGAREWADVLGSVFGYGANDSASGSLVLDSDQPLLVSSRTYNQGAAGTYGGYIPAFGASDGITAGQTGILPHLKGNASYRTNIGVTNLGSEDVTVQLRLYGTSGAQVGSTRTIPVPAGALVQDADVFGASGAGSHTIAYATVTTSGGRVAAYASVIDNATGDPTIVPLVIP